MNNAKPFHRNNPHLFRPPNEEEDIEPIYIRLPSVGTHCPYTSLARSSLDILTRPQALNDYDPPVKSKLMRQTGSNAKIRLIDFQSLKEYLNALPDDSQLRQKAITALRNKKSTRIKRVEAAPK